VLSKYVRALVTMLDTADIVIALGKLGRGGTEDETVKLLEGIQRV
jgi:hypothetical protein